MTNEQTKRVSRELTIDEQDKLRRHRASISAELPDLISRDQMRKEAHEEQTLSGEIRRAIHHSGISLAAISSQAGITMIQLDEFLTGERTLRSDVLDRLAASVGFRFQLAT